MKKNLFFLFLIIITGLGFSQESDIFYKIKINYSNQEDLLKLSNNGVCIDHGLHKKNHFLKKKKFKIYKVIITKHL